jgi:plasmid maintenance system antidote protein VapI
MASEKLEAWMKEKGFDTETLAQALGVSYSTVYMQTRGGRDVSYEMRWRFGMHFGFDTAVELFVEPEAVNVETI